MADIKALFDHITWPIFRTEWYGLHLEY